MATMTLEVILEMVDRLTGPARDSAQALDQLGDAVKRVGEAEAGLNADAWLNQGRAIVEAAEKAKQFETATIGAAEAERALAGGGAWLKTAEDIDRAAMAIKSLGEAEAGLGADAWLAQGQAIVEAAERAKQFETSAIDAAIAVKSLGEAEAGLNADAWLAQGQAIVEAAERAKQFETSAIDAAIAVKSLGKAEAGLNADAWLAQGQAIVEAAERAKQFETSTINAADAERALAGDGSWQKITEEIGRATAAVDEFDARLAAVSEKAVALGGGLGGIGGGGEGGIVGGGGKPKEEHSPFMQMLDSAVEFIGLMEGPEAIKETLHAGANLQDEEVAQRIAGMSPAQIAEAHQRALEYSTQFKMFPLPEIEKTIREGRTAFTTDEDAKALTPDILKLSALAERASPGHGMESAFPFMRALEEGGFTKDRGRSKDFLEDAARAVNFFGGTITGTDYQQVFNRAGLYGRSWNREFVRDALPHLLQSFHGDTTGTMLASLEQGIVGGHLMGPSLEALDKIGLLDEAKVHRNKGKITRIDPGAVKGADVAQRDPLAFAKDIFIPALKKVAPTEDQQVEYLTTIFGNRNAAKAFYSMAEDLPQFARTKAGIENPDNKGLDAVGALKDDPITGWTALKSAAENLAGIATVPAMGTIANALDLLAGGVAHMTKAVDGHPVVQSGVAAGILGLAGWGTLKGFGMLSRFFRGGGVADGAGGGSAVAEGAGAATETAGGGWLATGENALGALVNGGGWKGLAGRVGYGLGAAAVGVISNEFSTELMDIVGRELAQTGLFQPSAADAAKADKTFDAVQGGLKGDKASQDFLQQQDELHRQTLFHMFDGLRDPNASGEYFPDSAAPAPTPGWPNLHTLFGGLHDPNASGEYFPDAPSKAPAAPPDTAPAPKVDLSGLDDPTNKTKQLKQDLDDLNKTVSPKIDTTSIDALIDKLREAMRLLGGLSGGGGRAPRGPGGGGALNDGPEAH